MSQELPKPAAIPARAQAKPKAKRSRKKVAKATLKPVAPAVPESRVPAPAVSAKPEPVPAQISPAPETAEIQPVSDRTIAAAEKPAQTITASVEPLPRREAVLTELGLTVPPILLEGDEPPVTPIPVSGPGQKFLGGSLPPVVASQVEEGELPEAYGTGRVLLVARDPHCLYAHWDLTAEQLRSYNALSTHHHLIVRVHLDALEGPIVNELHVHPESRHWFIHADHAGARYVVELGYYQPDHQWRVISLSEPVATPPETVAEEKPVRFASVQVEAPPAPTLEQTAQPPVLPAQPPVMARVELFEPQAPESARIQALPPQAGREVPLPPAATLPAPAAMPVPLVPPTAPELPTAAPVPLPAQPVSAETTFEFTRRAEAPLPIVPPSPLAAPTGERTFPVPAPAPAAEWTVAQERALAELIGWTLVRKEWLGSEQIE
ncbi:MAG TPA: DUF4912 domain-containing protein, partial [Clostridia bacterium]|nr:DUF4912 domain-containing protein [Clostridia bacterium]